MWLRQIAQLSTTISHAHKATADHFLTSKRFRVDTDVDVGDSFGSFTSISLSLILADLSVFIDDEISNKI